MGTIITTTLQQSFPLQSCKKIALPLSFSLSTEILSTIELSLFVAKRKGRPDNCAAASSKFSQLMA